MRRPDVLCFLEQMTWLAVVCIVVRRLVCNAQHVYCKCSCSCGKVLQLIVVYLFVWRILTRRTGALLSAHPEHLQELVQVLASPPQGRGAGSAAKQDRLALFQQRSEQLQSCVSLLSQLSVYPSRRLAVVLVKDWLRFVRVEGLGAVLSWLPDLLTHLLPGETSHVAWDVSCAT